jgi:sulfur carrier protein
MQIILNGQPADLPPDLTVAGLLDRLELGGKRLAVEVDGRIVARSAHPTTVLAAGARVEIVHAIGGG